MIIDFTIEDLILNSYLQKNFHTLAKMPDQIEKLKLEYFTLTIAEYLVKR